MLAIIILAPDFMPHNIISHFVNKIKLSYFNVKSLLDLHVTLSNEHNFKYLNTRYKMEF